MGARDAMGREARRRLHSSADSSCLCAAGWSRCGAHWIPHTHVRPVLAARVQTGGWRRGSAGLQPCGHPARAAVWRRCCWAGQAPAHNHSHVLLPPCQPAPAAAAQALGYTTAVAVVVAAAASTRLSATRLRGMFFKDVKTGLIPWPCVLLLLPYHACVRLTCFFYRTSAGENVFDKACCACALCAGPVWPWRGLAGPLPQTAGCHAASVTQQQDPGSGQLLLV